MGVENIVKEATELLDIGDLPSSTFSWSSSSSLQLQLDRSAYNGVCQQVLELKILLLQLRRLLDWVRLIFIILIINIIRINLCKNTHLVIFYCFRLLCWFKILMIM